MILHFITSFTLKWTSSIIANVTGRSIPLNIRSKDTYSPQMSSRLCREGGGIQYRLRKYTASRFKALKLPGSFVSRAINPSHTMIFCMGGGN